MPSRPPVGPPESPAEPKINLEQLDAEVRASGLAVALSTVGDRVYMVAEDGSLVDPDPAVAAVVARHRPAPPPAPSKGPPPVVITGSRSTDAPAILAKLLDALAGGAPIINQTRP